MNKFLTRLFLAIVLTMALLVAGVATYQAITGRSLGLRSKAWVVYSQFRILLSANQFRGQQDIAYENIIFVHRSVGKGMLDEGKLREILANKGYQVWDQGYRVEGLRDPSGKFTGLTYFIPGDNTDPDGLYDLFSQSPSNLPTNGLSELFLHDVIMIKSCFTTSDIESDVKLDAYKHYYQAISAVMAQHPEKLFILVTQPPRNPAETDQAAAKRARELAQWLHSDAFQQGHTNIRVFDLFDLLAEPDGSADANTLKVIYRNGSDSHPNEIASVETAEKLAEFVIRVTEFYRTERSGIE